MLYANIGNIKDLAAVIQNDAGGIGLFRSEFLYLENEIIPTEEQQFAVYKQVAENMAGKKVIIVHWISELINRWIISNWTKKRIRHLDIVRSVFV